MLAKRYALVCLAGVAAFAAATGAAAETIRVQVNDLAFSPAEVSAHVGDTVEWINADFVAHTATARNKDWNVPIAANGTGRTVLKHAGKIDYYCRFHPNMTGRVSVTE